MRQPYLETAAAELLRSDMGTRVGRCREAGGGGGSSSSRRCRRRRRRSSSQREKGRGLGWEKCETERRIVTLWGCGPLRPCLYYQMSVPT
jgi:hypothetical protein